MKAHHDNAYRCPVCGGSTGNEIFAVRTVSEFAIHQCRECQLVSAFPRPDEIELKEFYRSGYYSRQGMGHSFGYGDFQMAEDNSRKMWHELARHPALAARPPGRLLDVGCGSGAFLGEAAKQGWAGTGLEFSREAALRARQTFGLHVIEGDLNSPSLAEGQFHLISMWHVLEHMLAPLAALQRCRQLLTPDQGLLLIELPNWSSVGRLIRGAKWKQMKPPEHLNFFSPTSLRHLLKVSGFDVIELTTLYPSMVHSAGVGFLPSVKSHLAGTCAKLGKGGYLRALATPA